MIVVIDDRFYISYSAFAIIDKARDIGFSEVLDSLSRFEISRLIEVEALLRLDGYSFHLIYRRDGFVLEESECFLEQRKAGEVDPKFKPSDARVEMLGDSDTNMDYFNDFLLILERLAENPSIVVYEAVSEEST